jgi:GTPase Era involved in 16S rRNA processing
MSNPLTRAFFIGRATAETIIDHLEDTLTDALSALGKFDAEQREKIRNFAETVLEKASQQEGITVSDRNGTDASDLQETIDNLRAEIAQLKSEMQQHRTENRV